MQVCENFPNQKYLFYLSNYFIHTGLTFMAFTIGTKSLTIKKPGFNKSYHSEKLEFVD